MSSRVSRENAEHYLWGDGERPCEGWHLVKTPALSVIQERMPPGMREQRHLHEKARQFFFVLEGALTMEMDGQTQVLSAREGIEIAPGVVHQAINASAADVWFTVTSVPPSHGDRVNC